MKLKLLMLVVLSGLLSANSIYLEDFILKIRIQKPIKNQIIYIDKIIEGKQVEIKIEIRLKEQTPTNNLPEDLRNLL